MDVLLLVMRILHVPLGVFWVGAMLFNAFFLIPAMSDAGPDAAKVGAALLRRRFADIMPWVALLTLISGFWLYWKASAGFTPAYMGSAPGITYGAGAVFAFAGFLVGIIVMRPAMLKAAALSQAAAASPADREANLAAAQALRARSAGAARLVARLLGVTVLAMAIGRYV